MLPRKFISYHSLLPTGPFSFPSISRLVLSSLFKRQFSNTLSSPFLRLCECFYFHLDLVTRYLGQNARWYPEKIWERVKERERERGGAGRWRKGKEKSYNLWNFARSVGKWASFFNEFNIYTVGLLRNASTSLSTEVRIYTPPRSPGGSLSLYRSSRFLVVAFPRVFCVRNYY